MNLFAFHKHEYWLEVPIPTPFEYVGLYEVEHCIDYTLTVLGWQFRWWR